MTGLLYTSPSHLAALRRRSNSHTVTTPGSLDSLPCSVLACMWLDSDISATLYTHLTIGFLFCFGFFLGFLMSINEGSFKVVVGVFFVNSHSSFIRLNPALSLLSECRYVAVDLAGHGHSSHRSPGVFYSFPSYVMDVRRVIDGV